MSSAATTAKELQEAYLANRAQTKDFIIRANNALAIRKAAGPPAGPAAFFQRFAYNYGTRHVHTNTFAPMVHILLVVVGSGMTMQYFGRHRHKHAAKAAQGDHHDAHHH
ncbi:Aste57867_25401 [Aphanomyces stellatus]|uniref:Aste57867_25401 protein n=1 Tax=Aphanomyces stellatus TaxID=120398 RepID=A0A485LTP5_9STRA|nr:hypothetical protein As57867_025322 [Aphanomyces stellatus]VFU02025.1 Aste57867_25401 [Aphanomyces stellatus]